jgi:hypothetical protein
MKQFKLSRQTPGATLTKFHVLDSAGSIIGSINVQNEAADDLARHWLQPQAAAAAVNAGGQQRNPMVNANAGRSAGRAPCGYPRQTGPGGQRDGARG